MSDDELTTAEAKPLSPLQIFFVKVGDHNRCDHRSSICASYFFESFIASKAEQLTFLKGGPAFWGRIETKLYSLADAKLLAWVRFAKMDKFYLRLHLL